MTDTDDHDAPCRECGHRLGIHTGFGNCLEMTPVATLTSATVTQSCACPGYEPRDLPPDEGAWYDTHDAITGEVIPPGEGAR